MWQPPIESVCSVYPFWRRLGLCVPSHACASVCGSRPYANRRSKSIAEWIRCKIRLAGNVSASAKSIWNMLYRGIRLLEIHMPLRIVVAGCNELSIADSIFIFAHCEHTQWRIQGRILLMSNNLWWKWNAQSSHWEGCEGVLVAIYSPTKCVTRNHCACMRTISMVGQLASGCIPNPIQMLMLYRCWPPSKLIIFEKLLNWHSISIRLFLAVIRVEWLSIFCKLYSQRTEWSQYIGHFNFTFCLHCHLFCKFLIKNPDIVWYARRSDAGQLCVFVFVLLR